MKHKPFLLLVLSVLSATVLPASAVLITFSDGSSFIAATSASAATTIPTTPPTVFPVNAGFTSGSLSFSLVPGESDLFAIDDWTSHLSGNELAISGKESFNVDLAGSAFSFGFHFVEPEFDPNLNGPFVESTFTVTLLNGATTVGSFTFSKPNDLAQFVGVQTGVGESFNRVEIRETVGDIGNEFFGQFYTGQQAASVPEPSTYLAGALLLLPLAFGAFRKSRQGRTARPL